MRLRELFILEDVENVRKSPSGKTYTLFVLIFLLFLPLAHSTPVSETDSASSLSLDELRSFALAHSPRVAEIDADLARKLAQSFGVRRLSNPILSASLEQPDSYQDARPEDAWEVHLAQNLRLSDFGLRAKVSELMLQSAESARKLELERYLQKISLAYFRLWALQLEQSHVEAQKAHGERIARVLQEGKEQGRVSIAQEQTALANVAKAGTDLLGIQHEQLRAAATLTRLTSFDLAGVELKRPKLAELPSFVELKERVQNNPHSIRGRVEVRARLAKEQHALAKRDSFPRLQPRLGYSQNEEGDKFWGFGLSIPLPVFDRNQDAISESRSKSMQVRSELEYLKSEEFLSELHMLHDSARVKNQQAISYRDNVLPPLAKALKNAEESFRSGQLSLLELWTVSIQYHEALDRSTELWIEAYAAFSELSILSGELYA